MIRPMHLIALPALLIATPALAQSQTANPVDRSLYLAATAPSACVIDAPVASNAMNASYSGGQSSGQITIAELVDAQSAVSRASAIELDFPVICNGAHTLTVTSANGGLSRNGQSSGSTGTGFSQFLDYQIAIDWAGSTLDTPSSARVAALAVPQAADGQLAIKVSTVAGGGPLVAGQYSDTLTVQLTPSS